MPLQFRNIDATPDDPVRDWGFEGMLAAIDRGCFRDWMKLIDGIIEDPSLEPALGEAMEAAESRSTVTVVREMLAHRRRTPADIALDELRRSFQLSGLTQSEAADRIGTSQSRLSTYLSGKVTPRADILVAMRQLADDGRPT